MKITRGDSKIFRFQRRDLNGNVITLPADQVYFTIKKMPDCRVMLQKKLGDGIAFNRTNNYYYITIKPEDTQSMDFGNYGFDIEITQGEFVNTICVGQVKIGVEYTTRKDK